MRTLIEAVRIIILAMRILHKLIMISALVALAGCSTDPVVTSAPEMFESALQKQANADYQGAVTLYEEIQAVHPYGDYAQQSLLNLAYLHYQERIFEQAVNSAEKFIHDYPSHPNVDYARYLRAVSLQQDNHGLLERIILAGETNEERTSQVQAYEAYVELLELHPLSSYGPDAVLRISEIVNRLAESDLEIAIHYFRISAYAAAIRRCADLITQYPDSDALERTLAIMIASLVEINAEPALTDSVRSMQDSFPGSSYLEPALNGQLSLLAHMEIKLQPGDYFTQLIE